MPALNVWLLLSAAAFCCLLTSADGMESVERETDIDPILELKNYIKRLEHRFEAEVKASRVREESLRNELNEQKHEIQRLKRQTSQCTTHLREQEKMIREHVGQLSPDKLSSTVDSESTEPSTGRDMSETKNTSTNILALREDKRSDDYGLLQPIVSQMSQQLTEMEADIQTLKASDSHQDAAIASLGTTYVRWGSSSCPGSAETVYSSTMGGSYFNHQGAAANYLCLSPHPVFGNKPVPANNVHALLYGAEYDTPSDVNLQDNAVCSVCRIPRSSSVMIPGTNRCSSGWTLEYSGYLMAGYPTQYAATTEYICVDSSEEFVPGTQANDNGALLLYTVTRCGSLPCPPYANNKVVLCAVCSK